MRRPFFVRFSGWILLATALALPWLVWGVVQALRSNANDVKSWLPPSHEETTTFTWYWRHFPSDAFVLVSWDGCTLDSPLPSQLAQRLLSVAGPGVGPSGMVLFQKVKTGRELLRELIEGQGVPPPQALARLQGSLIGTDGRQTCLVVSLSPRALERRNAEKGRIGNREFLHAAVERIYEVAEKDFGIGRQELHLGGPPVDNVSIDQEAERSLVRLLLMCALVALVLSGWCLRSWKLTAIVFGTALFSAGLSLALVWYTGATMNAILLTMPTLVYVNTTSGAIHLANYYRDAMREAKPEAAPGRAVANAWIPLGLAAGTTAVGLASLSVSDLVPIKMFGVFSAIGVLVSLGTLVVFMPALLQWWSVQPGLQKTVSLPLDLSVWPHWRRVGLFIIRHNVWVTAACLLAMAIGAYGVSRVQTSVRLMRLFSPRARVIRDYRWLEQRLGPLVPMEIVVRIDDRQGTLDTFDQMRLVKTVQEAVAKMDEVGSALAAPTFAPALPSRLGIVERATWNVRLERHRQDLGEYWRADQGEQLWRISARVGALGELDYGQFVERIREVVEPVLQSYRGRGVEGISATYTGVIPLIHRAQQTLLDGLIVGFAGDLVLIGVAIALLMRRTSAGLLLMLPSLFPLALIFGAMGLAGIVVDTGTVMTPTVALGVTVDDAIHFMLWCRRGQRQGMNRTDSIMFAYQDCALAIYQSWAVIGLGLAAFSLSSFIPTRRFGYLMFTLLTISSVGNLVFLPALLAGPAGYFFWRQAKASPKPGLPRPRFPSLSPPGTEAHPEYPGTMEVETPSPS